MSGERVTFGKVEEAKAEKEEGERRLLKEVVMRREGKLTKLELEQLNIKLKGGVWMGCIHGGNGLVLL